VLAGATTVGLGTALFYDPLAPQKVNAGLDEYLRKCGLASIADLVGGLDVGKAANQAASG
jgi:dihydroorotate dehydrogenase (NAD+) catalytic subunit